MNPTSIAGVIRTMGGGYVRLLAACAALALFISSHRPFLAAAHSCCSRATSSRPGDFWRRSL